MSKEFRSLRYAAPAGLKEELQGVAASRAPGKVVLHLNFGGWLSAAAGAAAVCALVLWVAVGRGPGPEELVEREVVSSHVRSMMESHLFDVASSDSHTVKPWFNGRIDFAPKVLDLASAGFPLVGGRLDYVGNRPVAALVYRRDRHVINLFTWPSRENASAPVFSSTQGFHVYRWNSEGMAFYAVSDLNANSLREFVDLLNRPAP